MSKQDRQEINQLSSELQEAERVNGSLEETIKALTDSDEQATARINDLETGIKAALHNAKAMDASGKAPCISRIAAFAVSSLSHLVEQ